MYKVVITTLLTLLKKNAIKIKENKTVESNENDLMIKKIIKFIMIVFFMYNLNNIFIKSCSYTM